jgi:hypothetical protein
MQKKDTSGNNDGTAWDVVHKYLTVALALATSVLGYWQFQLQHKLDVEQSRLKQQVEKTKLVDQMLDRIEGYLDKQPVSDDTDRPGGNRRGLTETDKTRILISLLKIAAEVHLEQTGQLEKQEQKDLIRAIPLHYALLSDNGEMLVTIGSKPEDRKLWLAFARAAADPDVKRTAARALARIAALTTDGKEHARIIMSLLDLTVDWQVPELSDPVAEALQSVLKRIDEEDQKDIPDLAEAIRQAKAKFDLLKLQSEIVPAAETYAVESERVKVKAETIQQVSQVFQKLQAPQPKSLEIQDLIAKLRAQDKDSRRSVRSKLAYYGDRAIPDLLNALETSGNEYRIRIGVVTALLLMEQPVSIPRDKIALLTDLLGDQDATIRKTTASLLVGYLNSLAKRKHPGDENAIRGVIDALKSNLEDLDNPNGIYNSVVVLGEASGQMPVEIAGTMQSLLTHTRARLKQDRRSWDKTVGRIGKYLE